MYVLQIISLLVSQTNPQIKYIHFEQKYLFISNFKSNKCKKKIVETIQQINIPKQSYFFTSIHIDSISYKILFINYQLVYNQLNQQIYCMQSMQNQNQNITEEMRGLIEKYTKVTSQKSYCKIHTQLEILYYCTSNTHSDQFYCFNCFYNHNCKIKKREDIVNIIKLQKQEYLEINNKIIRFLNVYKEQNFSLLIQKIQKEICLPQIKEINKKLIEYHKKMNQHINKFKGDVAKQNSRQKSMEIFHNEMVQIGNYQLYYHAQFQRLVGNCFIKSIKEFEEIFEINAKEILCGKLLKDNESTIQQLINKSQIQDFQIKNLTSQIQNWKRKYFSSQSQPLENQKLSNELKQYKSKKITDFSIQKNYYQQQILRLRASVSSLESQRFKLNDTKRELDRSQRKIASLQQEVKKIQTKLGEQEQLNKKMRQRQPQVRTVQFGKSVGQQQQLTLKKQLSMGNQEDMIKKLNAQLKSKQQKFNSQLKIKSQIIQQLQKQKLQYKQSYENNLKSFDKTTKQIGGGGTYKAGGIIVYSKNSEDELKKKQSQNLEKFKINFEEINQKNQKLVKQNQQLKKQLNFQIQTRTKLQQNINQRQNISYKVQKIPLLQKQIASCKSQNQKLNRQKDEISKKLQQQNSNSKKNLILMQNLKTQINQYKNTEYSLRQELYTKSRVISQQQQKIKNLTQENRNIEQSLKIKLENLEKQNKQLILKKSQYENTIKQYNDQLSKYKNILNQVYPKYENNKNELQQIKINYQQYINSYEVLQTEHTKFKTKLAEKQDQIKKLEIKITQNENKFNDMNQIYYEKNNLQQQLKKMKNNYSQLQSQYNQQKMELEKQMTDLRQSCQKKNEIIAQYFKKVQDYQNDFKNSKDQRDNQNTYILQLQQRIKISQQEKHNLQEKLKNSQQINQNMVLQRSDLQTRNTFLNYRNQQKQKEANSLSQQLQNQKIKSEQLLLKDQNEQQQKKNRTIQQLNKKIKQLQDQVVKQMQSRLEKEKISESYTMVSNAQFETESKIKLQQQSNYILELEQSKIKKQKQQVSLSHLQKNQGFYQKRQSAYYQQLHHSRDLQQYNPLILQNSNLKDMIQRLNKQLQLSKIQLQNIKIQAEQYFNKLMTQKKHLQTQLQQLKNANLQIESTYNRLSDQLKNQIKRKQQVCENSRAEWQKQLSERIRQQYFDKIKQLQEDIAINNEIYSEKTIQNLKLSKRAMQSQNKLNDIIRSQKKNSQQHLIEIQKLVNQISKYKDKQNEVNIKIQNQNDTIQTLNNQIQQLNDRIQTLSNQIENHQDTIRALSNQIQQLNEKLEKANNTIKENTSPKKNLDIKYKMQIFDLEKKVKENQLKFQQVTKQLELQQNAFEQLQQQKNNIQQKCLDLQRKVEDFENKKRVAEIQVSERFQQQLKTINDQYKTKQAEYQKKIRQLQSSLKEANFKISIKVRQITKLNNKVRETEQQLKNLPTQQEKNKIFVLNKQLQEVKRNYQIISQQHNELKNVNENLLNNQKKKQRDLTREIQVLHSELQQIRTLNQQLNKKINNQNNNIAHLEKNLNQRNNNLKEKIEQILLLTKNLEEAKLSIQKAHESLNTHKSQLIEFQLKLAQKDQFISQKSIQMQALNNQIKELQQTILYYSKKIQQQQSQISIYNNNNDNKSPNINNKAIKNYEGIISNLKQELKYTNEQLTEMSQRRARKEEQLQAYISTNRILIDDINESFICLEDYHQKLTQKKAECQELKKQLREKEFIFQNRVREKQINNENRIRELENYTKLPTDLIDKDQIFMLLGWLEKRISVSRLKLIYVASQHQFTSQSFHRICDNKPRLLLIARCKNEKIFGGFSFLSFGDTDENNDSSFIFSITHRIDLNLKPGKKSTCLDLAYGPIFGGDSDLRIRSNKVTSNYHIYNNCYQKNLQYLPVPPKQLFCGSGEAEILDYQIYQVITNNEQRNRI